MTIEVQVTINGPGEAVWEVITDIENATETISGIEQVEVLEKPENGLIGLKWRETRKLFGKTATEEMWITDAAANEFYKTRAESHGCVYITTMSISGSNGGSSLTMSHQINPQALIAKLMSPLMGFIFNRVIRKVILQDLNDIKAAVENQGSDDSA
jgi:carbon monoxide dehydrogenase subunit G